MVLIDVGNTKTKVKLSSGKFLEVDTQKIESLSSMISSEETVLLSSVVKEATIFLKKQFKKVILVSPKLKLPIKIEYKTKETLGADRIAQACGGTTFFNSFIVASFGTATVIDVVENSTFKGGWIFPGIGLSFECLRRKTSMLPEVKDLNEVNLFTPGDSSKNCLEKGVLLFSVSALEKISSIKPYPIIITGGYGSKIKRFFPKAKYVENLVILGLEVIGKYYFS